MLDQTRNIDRAGMDVLYAEAEHVVEINVGGKTLHAKRMGGPWRRLKWMAGSIWLVFFFGPYLQWSGRQAVLFDIPNRQFHLFGATILPQDLWMLSLTLLFFAILLAVATALAGRVFCGFFCFQTVWTDLFTLIEDRLEGPPQQRRKLDAAPWSFHKFQIKATKHALWLAISLFTGIAFVSWFTDAYQLLGNLVAGTAHPVAYGTIALFIIGTYVLAGFMREQACFWLCPYARIQSAMVDKHTVIPTYDLKRGEPRGRVQKGNEAATPLGDCVDCKLCVAVCPTGVDIRNGLQEGCLMCALCIDACDNVMDKVDRPRGLVRFTSLDEIEGAPILPLYKRTRVWVYSTILLVAFSGVLYGFASLEALELKVLHARQPLYVLQSDGSIQNRYTLKILNKSNDDLNVKVSATGPEGLVLADADRVYTAQNGRVTSATVFVRVPGENIRAESEPILFRIETQGGPQLSGERESVFMGPEAGDT